MVASCCDQKAFDGCGLLQVVSCDGVSSSGARIPCISLLPAWQMVHVRVSYAQGGGEAGDGQTVPEDIGATAAHLLLEEVGPIHRGIALHVT